MPLLRIVLPHRVGAKMSALALRTRLGITARRDDCTLVVEAKASARVVEAALACDPVEVEEIPTYTLEVDTVPEALAVAVKLAELPDIVKPVAQDGTTVTVGTPCDVEALLAGHEVEFIR